MSQPVRRGARFEHARLITGSPKAGTARPEVCEITRVTTLAIYYVSSSGMKLKVAPEQLPEIVKTWL